MNIALPMGIPVISEDTENVGVVAVKVVCQDSYR